MNLDVRIPIGLMFTIIGVALAGFGLVSDRAIYERSLGINVNLWWGLVLLVFGLSMLALATRAERNSRKPISRGGAETGEKTEVKSN